MNKCQGCGALTDLELCERCFRIRHYNEYKQVVKQNSDFVPILQNIKKEDLTLLLVDLFNIPDLSLLKPYLSNKVILVLTKRDILPKRVFDEKLLNYNYGINCLDKIIISSKKNYQFDELINLIKKHNETNNIYVVGFTNAGKSTMINNILYHYANSNTQITTSPLPSTTLDMIEIKFEDLTFYDTPGIILENDLINYIDGKTLKTVVPRREIKPITYQIKGFQTLIIDEFVAIEAKDIDLTLFMSNDLNIKRIYKKIDTFNNKKEVEVNKNDIVISGLGFIKTNKKSKVIIYSRDNLNIYTRSSLI